MGIQFQLVTIAPPFQALLNDLDRPTKSDAEIYI